MKNMRTIYNFSKWNSTSIETWTATDDCLITMCGFVSSTGNESTVTYKINGSTKREWTVAGDGYVYGSCEVHFCPKGSILKINMINGSGSQNMATCSAIAIE